MSGNACNNYSRAKVIALVDMDCFYVQVEERDNPSIKGTPAAVVQYKAWKGGGIIAVNYEARARGVTRYMRGDDAKGVCPEIVLVRVPEVNEKANLTKYRDAGKQVLDVICEFSSCVERASIDEAYIDLTETVNDFFLKCGGDQDPLACLDNIDTSHFDNNFPVGFESSSAWLESLRSSEIIPVDDIRLAVGAEIVGRMRQAVYEKTGFRCSAGIAHNKILAKLGGGLNKPNKQTVIPHEAVPELYSKTKIKKVRNLGGQFGDILVGTYKCENMSDLLPISMKQFIQDFGEERGMWLYHLARGYDDEPVTKRQLPQSIGCSKNFMGREALDTKEKVTFWIGRLSQEIIDRIQNDLEMNNRRAKLISLHVKFQGKKALSRSCGKNVYYHPEKMANYVMMTMEKLYQQYGVLPINNLGIIASKLEDDSGKSGKIDSFYRIEPHVSSKEQIDSSASNRPPSPVATSSKLELIQKKHKQEPKNYEAETSKISKLVDRTITFIGNKASNEKTSSENNVHISDDEEIDIDVEKFTPDSPLPVQAVDNQKQNQLLSNRDADSDFDFDAETSCDESPLQNKIESKNVVRRRKTTDDDCIPLKTETEASVNVEKTPTKRIDSSSNVLPENPPKTLFFCSKSPTKVRNVVNSDKVNPATSIVSTLAKQIKQVNKNAGDSNNLAGSSKFLTISGTKPTVVLQESDYFVGGIDTRTLAKEYLQECDRCHKPIPLWEIASHSDFHVAFDLQEKYSGGIHFTVGSVNQNNNSIHSTNTLANPSGSSASGQKRTAAGAGNTSSRGRGSSKRGRSGKASSSASKEQMKTLDSYFLPKNLS